MKGEFSEFAEITEAWTGVNLKILSFNCVLLVVW